MKINVEDYLNGRDTVFPDELTPEIRANAEKTVRLANALIVLLEADGVVFEVHPVNRTVISSGWRPPQINRNVKGAAVRSKHMTGEAIDIYDPDGEIDEYLLAHQDGLVSLGLWLEHPGATKGWSHWQIVPPRSLNRVFYP